MHVIEIRHTILNHVGLLVVIRRALFLAQACPDLMNGYIFNNAHQTGA
jgi:hypothetical protein